MAWNGLEPLKYRRNMARETSKFLLGERGRLGRWETLKRMLRVLDLKKMEGEVKRLQVYDKSEISCLL